MRPDINKLKTILYNYLQLVPEVKTYCERCLQTRRWDGNIILMIIDASFNSIGLNYFQSVVPKVDLFRRTYIMPNRISSLEDLANISYQEFEIIWRNKRSWSLAKSVATYFLQIKNEEKLDDRASFRYWAKNSVLIDWTKDPIGIINGVGINTYQYLRMMGGIDTVMPDKIVKRIINHILSDSGFEIPHDDLRFIYLVEEIGTQLGYKPIELCWMTWLIQSESNLSRMAKYSNILAKI